MKRIIFLLVFCCSLIGFSQDNYIVKTEDGRRVLLKADYTWEYIDLEKPASKAADSILIAETAALAGTGCNLSADFEEPKLNGKIQSELKKGRATIKHVKQKVAKDYNCSTEDVILISVREKKEKAIYDFCANGTKVSYKRIGSTIIKNGKLF